VRRRNQVAEIASAEHTDNGYVIVLKGINTKVTITDYEARKLVRHRARTPRYVELLLVGKRYKYGKKEDKDMADKLEIKVKVETDHPMSVSRQVEDAMQKVLDSNEEYRSIIKDLAYVKVNDMDVGKLNLPINRSKMSGFWKDSEKRRKLIDDIVTALEAIEDIESVTNIKPSWIKD